MPRPEPTELAPFFARYVALVPEEDILPVMTRQLDDMLTLLRGVSEAESAVRHPPYTWSTKEVVGHLSDGERVFSYRALWFAREDTAPLPGFDENAFAASGAFDRLTLRQLTDEFEAVRRSTLFLFQHLSPEAWTRIGVANDSPLSVRALAYIMVGHVRHHERILRQRLGRA